MIAATVEELTPIIGTRPACRAVGASPATIYRRRRPPEPRPPKPRPTPARALSEPERQQVLEVLHSRAVRRRLAGGDLGDAAGRGHLPVLDRTMYRILAAHHGGVRERRDQLTHPAYAKPELLAERPNELWSWDVIEAEGPGEVDLVLPVRDPRRVQPFCGAPQNGCSVPGSVMWPVAAGANDDGGERPGGGVFGHITLRAK